MAKAFTDSLPNNIAPAYYKCNWPIVAKSGFKMEGTVVFVIGGYTAKRRTYCKMGKLYRSADIVKLTACDVQVMEGKHIHTN